MKKPTKLKDKAQKDIYFGEDIRKSLDEVFEKGKEQLMIQDKLTHKKVYAILDWMKEFLDVKEPLLKKSVHGKSSNKNSKVVDKINKKGGSSV